MNAAAGRSRLEHDAVVEAGLGIVDREGLDALTVRRLALELGVTPTALYWHFADKQALLDALGDRLWADALDLIGEVAPPDAWDGLREIFDALVTVFRRHPALAPLAPSRALDCPQSLTITERALSLLAASGYDPAGAADAARILLSTAVMLVVSQPGAGVPDREVRLQLMRQKRASLLSLPPGRFPQVEASAGFLTDCEDESSGYFTLGVDLMMAGLRTLAPAARSPRS